MNEMAELLANKDLQAALARYAQELREHTLNQWNVARSEALKKEQERKERVRQRATLLRSVSHQKSPASLTRRGLSAENVNLRSSQVQLAAPI